MKTENKNPLFWDVLTHRRSIRSFLSAPIPTKTIQTIIAAGLVAPSGSNVKNWDCIVVTSPALKEAMHAAVEARIAELTSNMKSPTMQRMFSSYAKYFTFFSKAPVVLCMVLHEYDSLSARILEKYETDTLYRNSASMQNGAAAIQNMLLAADALGYGACWMTGPLIARAKLEALLGIASPSQLAAIIPVGKPKAQVAPHALPKTVNLDVR